MQRRLAPVLLSLGLVGLVGCGGDDSPAVSDTLPPVEPPATDTTAPPADGEPPTGGEYEHPTGADDVVIEYAEVGGFTTREVAFQQVPNVLIAGDGRTYSPGAQIAIFPGPLLPAVQVWTIGEDGIQEALAAAEEAGLFADIDYDQPTNVADASTARVTINVNGETYVHEAYALGLAVPGGDGAESPERQALADFIGVLQEITAPGPTGDPGLFEPSAYGIEATPVDDPASFTTDGIEPTVVDWPEDAAVALADATGCTVVSADDVGDVLQDANQLTLFDDDGTVYQVLATPILPGTVCG